MSSIEIGWIKTGHKKERDWTLGDSCIWEWDSDNPDLFGRYGVSHDVFNATDKTIKYATFTYEPINHFGDAVAKAKSALYTGPLNENKTIKFMTDTFWFWEKDKNYKIRLVNVSLEYMDGTQEIIRGEDIKDINAKDSVYNLVKKKKKKEETNKAKEYSNKKLAQGIVAFAGKTSGKGYRAEKIGDVVFYFESKKTGYSYGKAETLTIVGWESTKHIEHLEIPDGIDYISKGCLGKQSGVKSVTLPRNKNAIIRFSHGAYLGIDCVNKIIIPKEARYFCVDGTINLGDIREIEFESPSGWGIKKEIISDPKKMYDYIVEKGTVELKRKTFLGIIFSLFS